MGQQSITPPRHLSISLWIAIFLLQSALFTYSQTRANTIPLIVPSAIAYDSQGNLYIAETSNHVIRKLDAAGLITTIAGTGTQGFSGDGSPATAAQLDSPQGLALDANNNLYIADTHNHRVRKLDLTTGLITTIAGSTAGFSGDNGPAVAARLNLPTALTVDANNNLYIADTQNYRIRKITAATGLITTVAGNGIQGFSGNNGPATSASIDSPTGLAVDTAGDLYLSDTHNHRIRKVTATTGLIATIAGTGAPRYSGDSSPATAATIALPHGLSIDGAGNLYIADTENHRIRRIDAATGAITTVAGSGIQTFSGDDGPAALAALDSPRSSVVSPTGLLTLADTGNERIRQLDAQTTPVIRTIAGLTPTTNGTLTLTAPSTILYGTWQLTASLASATPATGSLTFTLLDTTTAVATTIANVPLVANTAAFDSSTLPAGSYTLIATYAGDPAHPAIQSQTLAFRILPRPLVATPAPVTILYGQPIPSLTGTITGLLSQDDGSLATSFTAQITPLSPPAAYPISASISGLAAKNYTLTTTPASLTVSPAPTVTTITASATSTYVGTPVTLTAHVASTTTGTPTGSVAFVDGNTPLQTLTASSGDAIFTTSTLTPGTHSITTLYAGDKDFIPSTSTPALINVISASTTPPDFTLTPTGTANQAIPSGGSANFDFTVQIQGSTLASPITLAATGLPALATASFNPTYLPPGATPDTFILTINTPQTTALHHNPESSSPLLAFLLFPLTGIVVRLRSGRRPAAQITASVLAALILSLCSGCGSRINTSTQSTDPVRTYTITVTGTATSPTGSILQHSATVDLLIHSAA